MEGKASYGLTMPPVPGTKRGTELNPAIDDASAEELISCFSLEKSSLLWYKSFKSMFLSIT
jgi:hypothetical protein